MVCTTPKDERKLLSALHQSESLLEVIYELLNHAYIRWKLLVREFRWLGHVDFIKQSPMSKNIIDIKLAKRPVVRDSQIENNVH